MNITELDQYNLADAVKFHNRLNPRLWGSDEQLLPEVRSKLLEIAADFQEFLGLSDLDVEDITLSGSNAAYSYTPHSDIDLHLVVNVPKDEVYQELFNAKKYQYNDIHNIKVRGADVELYVQPADEAPVSLGEYSIKNNKWIEVPKRKRAKIDQTLVRHKYEDLKARIESALKEDDSTRVQALITKIKAMRQSGLDAHGEFGPENLAFKILRSQGWIKKLYDHVAATKDRELSLKEQPKSRITYGFRTEDAGETWDGVNPTTCMFLNEEEDNEKIVHQFINWVADKLGITEMPEILIHTDPAWSVENHSFGRYEPDTHRLHVSMSDRHLFDILRTTAHELAHCKQNQAHPLPDDAGETGSQWENEAHAAAGIIMRDFADAYPELFATPAIQESASGYIPTKKQARDPRYATALTVDIKPGQVGKEANKMGLQTDSQGRPALLMKTVNLRESRNDGNEPRGPEFKPTMPRGTVRVNVSDVYDWYKLGKNIANLDRANPADFGKGPPSTIVSFGDEDTEHRYIKNLKKLGLTTTDIDPKDPNQPAGLPRQSTDPTYNVDEEDDLVESLRQEFEQLEEEYLGEIKMSPTNLRQEAAKTGARAGMEFEMIVPEAGSVDDSGDMEPDWDMDESVRDIEDACNFFYDGDYNGRADIQRLRNSMQEDYESWVYEHFDEYWMENAPELIREYLTLNASDRDIIEILELAGGEAEEVEENGATKQDYTAAAERVMEDQDSSAWYDDARDAAQNDYLGDTDRQEEWLDSAGIRTMQDVQSNYDITWPHYYNSSEGEADIDSIADDFSRAIGKPINASRSYHGARREAGHYVVEPDGSLEGEDADDAGLEFVSPPMPIDEMMSDLNKVKAWADSRGCYTNDSTGLHINISVPNYSLRELDYVKLALLLGDKYVLEQFGRVGNTYCKAAIGKVQDKVRQYPETSKELLDKMRNGMEQLASKAIHSGTTDKYTSINTKDGYIEFRSPGGDWLNANFDKIENTLLRFTVALSAAMDPEAYRQEYLKKLYKLLEPTAVETKNPDTIKYFADYVAGKTPRAALRSFVKQAQLERKIKKDPTGGQKYWWDVSRPGYFASIEVVASSREEAIDKAIEPGNYPDWARARNTLQAKPLRPYDASPVKATVGTPQPAGGMRPSNPDGNYVIFSADSRAGDPPAYRFMAADNDDADTVLLQWSREHPGNWEVHYDANQRLGQPGGNTNTLSQSEMERRLDLPDQTGDANYEIVDRRTGRRVFVMIANTEYDARRKYADWLSAAGYPIETEDYGFREIALPGSTMDLQRQRAAQAQPQAPMGGQNFPRDTTQQPTPRSMVPGREFAGWKVLLPSGEEVYRFSGVGNSQADANRIAADWLRNNGMGVSGEGYEVVPVWNEA